MSTKAQRARTGKPWMIPDSLTHAGGIITAIFSGKSYQLTLPALVVNNLYFIYFVPNTGLAISTTAPSAQTASRILVGAFYAGFGGVWGTFVNIEGSPTSGVWNGGLVDLVTAGGTVTKGTTYIDQIFFRRDGKINRVEFNFGKNGAGGSAPAGNYHVLSSQFNVDSLWVYGGNEDASSGIGHITTPGDGRIVKWAYGGAQRWEPHYTTPSNTIASTTTHPYASGTFRLSGAWSYPVNIWDETPLKDL